MPKCPFVDIFHPVSQKTTPPATTITSTFNTTAAPLNTTAKQITEESKHTLMELTRPTNEGTPEIPRANVNARKQNSSETRKNISKYFLVQNQIRSNRNLTLKCSAL